MNSKLYLLNIRIMGIKNLEAPIALNFYKKGIKNDFNPDKYKIKAIYGENGSGKTAVITAIKIMQNLVLDRNYLSDTDTQKSLFELINKKTKKGFIDCEFYADLDKKYICHYKVDFAIKEDSRCYITHEVFECKNGNYSKNNYITIYEIDNGKLLSLRYNNDFEWFKEHTLNLLSQQSFAASFFNLIIMTHEEGIESELSDMFLLLLFALSINICLDSEDNHRNYFINKTIQSMNEDELENLGIDYVKQIRNRISDSSGYDRRIPQSLFGSYAEYVKRLCTFIQIFKPSLQNIEIDKKENKEFYICNLKMVYKEYSLDIEFESRGIKKLVNLYSYLNSASNGSIVFIDELDSNINDVYLDKIIEHFIYYGEGQLCFTTHNLSPMSVLKSNKNSISFISSVNTVHTWTNNGNSTPENAYRNGFIDDSPFNVDASDFLGIIGGDNE